MAQLASTLGSEVCPEIREYERQSTTANAYVMPLMASYLRKLETDLKAEGFACPFLLMTSGGSLVTVETAANFPIRLVESGPAGGAILAAHIARELGEDRVLSFDCQADWRKWGRIRLAIPSIASDRISLLN